MSSQFCDQCPTDMPEYRDAGRWVQLPHEEHELPIPRPMVEIDYDDSADLIHVARLPIMDQDGWRGEEEFRTLVEAMDYASTSLFHLARTMHNQPKRSLFS